MSERSGGAGGRRDGDESDRGLGAAIRGGAQWLLAGNLSSRAAEFAIGVVLARLLVPADFGLLVTVQIFTGVVGYFAAGGMGQALVQAVRADEEDYHVVFSLQLCACLGIYALLFGVAPYFAAYFREEIYTPLLRASALTFLVRPFANVPNARLHRAMRFKERALVRLATIFVRGCASIAMAVAGMGVWSLVLGGIAGSVANAAMLLGVTRWTPRIRFRLGAARRLGAYGVKVSANDIVQYVNQRIGNLVLSRVLGPAPVGLFNKALSLNRLPTEVVSGSTYQPVFRALAKVQEDRALSREIFLRALTLVSAYVWPVYLAFWVYGEEFIAVVYGERWRAAAAPLSVLVLAGLFLCVSNQSGAVIAAQDRLGRELWVQLQYGLALVLAAVVGVRWGIVGIAWAVVPCELFRAVAMYRLAAEPVGATFADLTRALWPSVALNGLVLAGLLAAATVGAGLRASHPAVYLVVMAAVTAALYGAAFLLVPIRGLEREAERWRRMLGRTARLAFDRA